MENHNENSSEQGLLDLSVELSTSDVTAGNEFAIFVLVKNPFSKPVWVREVNVSLPSELKRVDDEKNQQKIKETQDRYKSEIEERRQEQKNLEAKIDLLQQQISEVMQLLQSPSQEKTNELSALLERLRYELDRLESQLQNNLTGASNVTIYAGTEIDTLKIGSQLTNVTINKSAREYDDEGDSNSGDKSKKIRKSAIVKQIEIYEPWLIHEQQSQDRIINLKSSLPDNAALQPGSTAVYTVVLNVKRSLIFTPSRYRLQFYVNYNFTRPTTVSENTALPEKMYTNTIAHLLSIRPSVYSVITGSVIGGTVGAIARLLQSPSMPATQSVVVSLFLSIILGAMAVIFMARKSDAQSFVSVEDFWGGILIGFLVGYTGTSFFESIAGVQIPSS